MVVIMSESTGIMVMTISDPKVACQSPELYAL